jgi:hypothetical protein
MSMSAIASPRLGIGPLIRENSSDSSVLFSSRKRSCWLAGWCGLQMALKPWPFHVPNRPARAPSGSGPAASALTASVASASGVASPANAKSESVCVPAVMMTPSRISSHLAQSSFDHHDCSLVSSAQRVTFVYADVSSMSQRRATASLIHLRLLLRQVRHGSRGRAGQSGGYAGSAAGSSTW